MRLRALLGAYALMSPITFAAPVQLANTYDDEQAQAYLVSEKLDGIRAIWDGSTLTTRNGHPIVAPDWFTKGWPEAWLDGELWAGRNRFSLVQQTVLDQKPNHSDWRHIHYYVFDAPDLVREFSVRAEFYQTLVTQLSLPHLKAVKQREIESNAELYAWLDDVVAHGGEGLMLHRKDAKFRDGRSDALLKLKPYMDKEAKVIGYTEGKGKYEGMVGALVVELADGRQFRLGSGLSDQERASPPPIGAFVTFKYQGLTVSGLPRFATFVRVRRDDFSFF